MKVIERFRARKRDMKTLSGVISDSLERAQRAGDEYAGAHHLILTALEMEDGSAARVFADVGASSESFRETVAAQERDALRSLGLPDGLADSGALEAEPGTGRYGKADATYEQAIKNVHEIHNRGGVLRPLISVYVLAGAAEVDRGVAARALKAMNIDVDRLVDTALSSEDNRSL